MRAEVNANCYAKWDSPVAFSNITSNGEKNPTKTSAVLKRIESFFRLSSPSYWGWYKALILRPSPWSLWNKVHKGGTALIHKVTIMFLYSVSHYCLCTLSQQLVNHPKFSESRGSLSGIGNWVCTWWGSCAVEDLPRDKGLQTDVLWFVEVSGRTSSSSQCSTGSRSIWISLHFSIRGFSHWANVLQ